MGWACSRAICPRGRTSHQIARALTSSKHELISCLATLTKPSGLCRTKTKIQPLGLFSSRRLGSLLPNQDVTGALNKASTTGQRLRGQEIDEVRSRSTQPSSDLFCSAMCPYSTSISTQACCPPPSLLRAVGPFAFVVGLPASSGSIKECLGAADRPRPLALARSLYFARMCMSVCLPPCSVFVAYIFSF